MSKRTLSSEQAAHLPGQIFYTVDEVAWMTKLEYDRVLDALKAEEIPSVKFGRVYRIPAWWVEKHLTGVGEPEELRSA